MDVDDTESDREPGQKILEVSGGRRQEATAKGKHRRITSSDEEDKAENEDGGMEDLHAEDDYQQEDVGEDEEDENPPDREFEVRERYLC